MGVNRFSKNERLCSKVEIAKLFKEGKSLFVHPLKAVYGPLDPSKSSQVGPLRVGVTVPKRQFKKATERNHLKRLIREAYRCNKSEIINTLARYDYPHGLMYIFVHKEKSDFETIEKAVIKLNHILAKELK